MLVRYTQEPNRVLQDSTRCWRRPSDAGRVWQVSSYVILKTMLTLVKLRGRFCLACHL